MEPEDLIILRFQKQEVHVMPYIEVSLQKALFGYYMETMRNTDDLLEYRFIEAEQTIMLAIIDKMTSIEISELNLDTIISSGFWNQIRSCILNYNEFRSDLDKVLSMVREDEANEKSIGTTFDALVFDIRGLINKFANVDLSEEGVSKILKALNTEKDEINKIVNPSLVPDSPKKKTKKEILQ